MRLSPEMSDYTISKNQMLSQKYHSKKYLLTSDDPTV